MSGQYRKQYYKKNNRGIGRKSFHKKQSNQMLWFYLLLVIVLLFAILITTGKIERLQTYLSEKRVPQAVEEAEPEVVTPISSLRVVLLADDLQEYRTEVSLMTEEKTVTTYTQKNWQAKENKVTFDASGQLIYLADSKGNKISQGYTGKIEVWNLEAGLVVVNEVPLEEYLARVLPSEMPQSYGLEALKAQAVCARSYAYVQARDIDYPLVSAQMDDSTSYQVYNKQPQNELATEAVRQTANQILMKDDKLVETLYYSTSCGYTQDGSLFEKENASYLSSVYVGDEAPAEKFTSYITHEDENAYEKDEKYFRWNVVINPIIYQNEFITLALQMNQEDEQDVLISKKLLKQMKKIQQVQESQKKESTETDLKFKNMKCIKRNEGGSIETLELEFQKGSVTISGEFNIRKLLATMVQSTVFHTGEVVERNAQTTMLCSGAFVWKEQSDETWKLQGGGFGHGCGMSQNGAKHLAQRGYLYQDILKFFYKDVTIQEMVANES